MLSTIIVIVKDGVIQDVQIPDDIPVEVDIRDYDVDDSNPNLEIDENGYKYSSSIWL